LTRIERLMSRYPALSFVFDKNMPSDMGGLTVNDKININANISESEQYQWLNEELGHYETSVGDISNYAPADNSKQENVARRWGYKQSLTYRQLQKIKDEWHDTDYEIADDLGLQLDYLYEVGHTYGLHFKHVK